MHGYIAVIGYLWALNSLKSSILNALSKVAELDEKFQ
jgi:hypothetical protein